MPNLPAAKLMDGLVGIDVHAITHIVRLRQIGLSSLGATQVLGGQGITSAADRALEAGIVAWAVSRQRLRALGMSALGVAQLLAGHPVSNPGDGTLVGRIALHAVAGGFGMHFWPRVGDEVIVA